MSPHTVPETSDAPARHSTSALTIASNRPTVPRNSTPIPTGDTVSLPRTAATNTLTDETQNWPTIRLHPDDAARYLEGEIYEWFKARGIDKQVEIEREKKVSGVLGLLRYL